MFRLLTRFSLLYLIHDALSIPPIWRIIKDLKVFILFVFTTVNVNINRQLFLFFFLFQFCSIERFFVESIRTLLFRLHLQYSALNKRLSIRWHLLIRVFLYNLIHFSYVLSLNGSLNKLIMLLKAFLSLFSARWVKTTWFLRWLQYFWDKRTVFRHLLW